VTEVYTGRLRSLALSFPESREDHPFGPEAHVFKVGGGSRMFAIMGDGPPVRVTLKLTKEEREIALTLPYVSEAKYVGRYGWVTSEVSDGDALDATLEWMRESYWMRAPEALRESAWTSGEGAST
jgi:predicted DNA-binding protein (MmcQ/YjbR family)